MTLEEAHEEILKSGFLGYLLDDFSKGKQRSEQLTHGATSVLLNLARKRDK